MNNFYDQLCDSFIRPSRQIYNSYDLGTLIIMKDSPSDRTGKDMISLFSILNKIKLCAVISVILKIR